MDHSSISQCGNDILSPFAPASGAQCHPKLRGKLGDFVEIREAEPKFEVKSAARLAAIWAVFGGSPPKMMRATGGCGLLSPEPKTGGVDSGRAWMPTERVLEKPACTGRRSADAPLADGSRSRHVAGIVVRIVLFRRFLSTVQIYLCKTQINLCSPNPCEPICQMKFAFGLRRASYGFRKPGFCRSQNRNWRARSVNLRRGMNDEAAFLCHSRADRAHSPCIPSAFACKRALSKCADFQSRPVRKAMTRHHLRREAPQKERSIVGSSRISC